MRREYLVVAGVIAGSILLMVVLAALGSRPRKPITDVLSACVQHTGVGMHIHPRLTIRIDGEARTIPANIGVTPGCMRPLHTHDDSGTIHAEFPVVQDARLADFFRVWDQPFSKEQTLDQKIGEGDTLRVTVNGGEQADPAGLVLHDGDDVVIEVKKNDGS